MRIQFDSEQAYQLDAIRAVVELFEGQQGADAFGTFDVDGGGGLELTEQGFGNALTLDPATVRKNLEAVQGRNDLVRYGPPDARMRFAVEMETGTGKTYVYLRTIFELHQRYGWSKFVIVVPSVAIREGVLSSLSLMREHFRELYDAVPYDHWVYDSAQSSRLRNFATGSALQILVLNIQAFDKKDVSVIYQERDATNGIAPIEYLRSSRPVVILDEPQNMGSKNARAAIEGLSPLFELHYSATHREMINPVYRLTPVEAYDLGLVKQIEVSSVLAAEDFNRPYLKLVSMTGRPKFSATVEMDVEAKGVQKRKPVKITKPGQDLFDLSGGLEKYRGYEVEGFDADEEWLTFINGERLVLGKAEGANHEAVMRAQVRETVERHFKREAEMRRLPEAERMKVLSLFFVDRVANYAPEDGTIRKWFVESYRETAAARPELPMPPVESVHYGYFAADKNGPKDSRGEGTTEADREAYNLIMRDKERLLSRDEPLAFLFTHSALREGWDNPNVFQICTLREVGSETQRRQQIGRGLRLPVQADGVRCRDKARNVLTVVASESFESFAKALQEEIKTDCGVEFRGRIVDAKAKERVRLRDGWEELDGFAEIWAKIRPRTRYNVQFSTEELIEKAAAELGKLAAGSQADGPGPSHGNEHRRAGGDGPLARGARGADGGGGLRGAEPFGVPPGADGADAEDAGRDPDPVGKAGRGQDQSAAVPGQRARLHQRGVARLFDRRHPVRADRGGGVRADDLRGGTGGGFRRFTGAGQELDLREAPDAVRGGAHVREGPGRGGGGPLVLQAPFAVQDRDADRDVQPGLGYRAGSRPASHAGARDERVFGPCRAPQGRERQDRLRQASFRRPGRGLR